MTPQEFYLGALGLFGIGAICMWDTSVLTDGGGSAYEAKRMRRVIGGLLVFAAIISCGIGYLSQSSSREVIPPPATLASELGTTGAMVKPQGPRVNPMPARASDIVPSTPERTPTAPLPPTSPIVPKATGPPGAPRADEVASPKSKTVAGLVKQAVQSLAENQFEPALNDANAALHEDPQSPAIYALRANIYATKHLWKQAEADYASVLRLDPDNVSVEFNLAQIEFAQKKYDAARPLFAAAQHDPDMADLTRYETFLCDLFGGHEDVAAKELAVFNQAGSGASYYFSNAAWSLVHHDKASARGWLTAAGRIYPPTKFKLYIDNLIGVGDAAGFTAPSAPVVPTSSQP